VIHGYQTRDYEVIDYEVFVLPDVTSPVRGPAPETLTTGEYFACLGAAQTFGCNCKQPFPSLLADRLGVPTLNLGFAGVGPRFFVQREPPLVKYANHGRFAIVQVMSGRSEDNSLFDSRGIEQLRRRSNGQRIAAVDAYSELLANESVDRMKAIVEETRENWVESYSKLLAAIEVPTILLWFSQRSPEYEESYADVWGMFGKFPQLVNRSMVERIRELSDGYVECVSSRGWPQRLISRFTGEPVSIDLGGTWTEYDRYYPSPEMHEDAAAALMEACRKHALSSS
jgi:Domain of unknown function (DUF6473)